MVLTDSMLMEIAYGVLSNLEHLECNIDPGSFDGFIRMLDSRWLDRAPASNIHTAICKTCWIHPDNLERVNQKSKLEGRVIQFEMTRLLN